MEIEYAKLYQTILKKEKMLLDGGVRASAEQIQTLLTHDFHEHCSSGIRYKYQIGDVFSHPNDIQEPYAITNFQIEILNDTSILATYTLTQLTQNQPSRVTLRSSIWVHQNNHWKIKFHQGTIAGQ